MSDQTARPCAPFLEVEVELLRPRAIIAIGRPAFDALLGQRRRGWPPVFEISHYGRAGQGHWGRYLRTGWEAKVPTLGVLSSRIYSGTPTDSSSP